MHSARWLKPWSQHRRGGERGTSEQMARRKAKCKRRSAEMVGHITEWDADAMQLKGNGLHEGLVSLRNSLLRFHAQPASFLVLPRSPPSNMSCVALTPGRPVRKILMRYRALAHDTPTLAYRSTIQTLAKYNA